MSETVSVHAIISGRVQGVCFRMETKLAADHKGICGWVRNRPDGTVEALFQGPKPDVDAIVEWCRMGGPPLSRVDSVRETLADDEKRYKSFDITY